MAPLVCMAHHDLIHEGKRGFCSGRVGGGDGGVGVGSGGLAGHSSSGNVPLYDEQQQPRRQRAGTMRHPWSKHRLDRPPAALILWSSLSLDCSHCCSQRRAERGCRAG